MKTLSSLNEEQLREMFDRNFERLRLENGHSLAPDVRQAAWEQVRCYWLKLRHIAETVTDTEVKLSLPDCKTPRNRTFCIEAVVDIVRNKGKVTMYDVKTHDCEFVRQNIGLYCDQINVYAYIWRTLRREELDEAAIIATPLPGELGDAIRKKDQARVEAAMAKWEPVVPVPLDEAGVKKTVAEFAKVVDQIEDGRFHAPAAGDLTKREGNGETFGTRVCRNCDVRFSCSSYRQYARENKGRAWTKFADFYDLGADEPESLARFDAAEADRDDRGGAEDGD